MIHGDITFEIVPEGRFSFFSGPVESVSHKEYDPPVSLQRLGGTEDVLIGLVCVPLFPVGS